MDKQKITLGSGKLYVTEYDGAALPNKDTIETETNLLGYISGGATLEYKPTFYEAKDDLGMVSKSIITEEEATIKSGILTFNGNTLKKLCATARVTEASGIRTVKIGGVGTQDATAYVIRFVHSDETDGDVRVTIVGKNQSGFSLAYAKDKETVIDAEFKAQPHDEDGTLIVYEEDIPVEDIEAKTRKEK